MELSPVRFSWYKRILSVILFFVIVGVAGSCALFRGSDGAKGKKLAVFFPGMGYTVDRPLLSQSRDILEKAGYEIKVIEWTDLPKNESTEPACEQAAEQLDKMKLDRYEEIIFVSKSIGTVASSTYVAEHDLNVRQIWYTPLQGAFDACGDKVKEGSIIAFAGTADNRSNCSQSKVKAEKLGIELHIYDDCNHSLECGDDAKNQEILDDVMKITSEYVAKKA